MRMFMFAVRDRAVQAFIVPFFLPSVEVARREFVYCANDPGHAFCRHKEDYSLYCLGEFESDTGELLVSKEPEFVCSAVSVQQPAVLREVASA